MELPFWDPWETAVLSQILAGSLLRAFWEPLGTFGSLLGVFWEPSGRLLGAQILARSLLEANFCHLEALRPAIKLPFWDPWETAVLGQILAGSFLGAPGSFWKPSGSLLGASGSFLKASGTF